MSRKSTRRRVWLPMPPRGLRPKLAHDQVVDLAICHHEHLDAIARGEADEDVLWQVAGAALTWSKVAELLGRGVDEMTPQLHLVAELVRRYGETGRVIFRGPEYQLAKQGVEVMDALAEIVDRPTAVIAAEWSERKVNELAASCRSTAQQRAARAAEPQLSEEPR